MLFPKLFEICKLGKLELPNRIVMLPMSSHHLPEAGVITDRLIEYYSTRASGGVGLVIVEDADIDFPIGCHVYNPMLIDNDKYVPRLRRLTQAIKAGGAKVGVNLNHGGRRSGRIVDGKLMVTQGAIPVAPSVLPHPLPGYVVPRELSIEEIEELEDKFAQAAWRARWAGFHLISLQAAHMYLINQFLSPLSNERKDVYGGDLNGRLRFLMQIIRKIKEKVGNDYPIMVRINGVEPMEGGVSLDETKEISRRLEAAGVDCISVSAGASAALSRRDFILPIAPMRLPRAPLVYLAAEIKQAVSVPVMTANRIDTPRLAEEILEQGKADLIGIGRGLIADPEWPKKAKEGRENEIRPCIACMYCLKRAQSNMGIKCAVNASAGQEAECKITPAVKPKTVFIAGGGAAGLEAARVASLRGHKVRVFEKERLGGQLNLAHVPPAKADIKLFLDYEIEQINRLGVKVEYKALCSEIIKLEKPDAVIVAVGAKPLVPSLTGVERKNVVTAWQVLKGEAIISGKVVVLGGGQVGTETAEYLAQKGNQVTILEKLDSIATDMDSITRQLLLFSLEDLGVNILTGATAKMVTSGVVIVDHKGKEQVVKADFVVLALGAQPNRELADRLKGQGIQFHAVGDCAGVRKLPDAVEDGFKAALNL